MKSAGSFNINEYLEKLHENAEGGLPAGQQDGLIIPEENKKAFGWIKKEFDKARTEVKVEIHMGGLKFEPGYELQTDLNSVKDFKPGMYGEIKTSDTPGAKKEKQEAKKETPKEGGSEAEESQAEKKAEKSTGDEEPKKKAGISGKVKTAEDTKPEPKKKSKGSPVKKTDDEKMDEEYKAIVSRTGQYMKDRY